MSDDGPIVIDVAESPVELAGRIAEGRQNPVDPVAERAQASMEHLLRIFTAAEWKQRKNEAARTKTVLSAVGRRTAIRLVSLGYLNAAIACNAHLDSVGIDAVPAPEWFSYFLDNHFPDEPVP